MIQKAGPGGAAFFLRTLLALKIVINFGGSEKICNFAKLKYGFGFSGGEKEG